MCKGVALLFQCVALQRLWPHLTTVCPNEEVHPPSWNASFQVIISGKWLEFLRLRLSSLALNNYAH